MWLKYAFPTNIHCEIRLQGYEEEGDCAAHTFPMKSYRMLLLPRSNILLEVQCHLRQIFADFLAQFFLTK